MCNYPTDSEAEHIGCYYEDLLIGIVSYHQEFLKNYENKICWRLRGMAILPKYQNNGVGTELVYYGNKMIKDRNGELIWCNARKAAIEFYKKLNFTIIGNEFNISDIGTHLVMIHFLK